MTAAADHVFVDSPAGLDAIAEALATASWVAIDSESNSMFVHVEQVCLIQLNVAGKLFVIDPIALGVTAVRKGETPSTALAALAPGLARTDRPLFVHGGEYDAAVLERDFGWVLGGLYDTQQAASLLGYEKTGYGALVEKVCDVKLGKAFATYDWKTRPLDPAALAYAIDDVVYLPRVAEVMRAEVAAADIVDEVDVANQVVADARWTGGFDPHRIWRIKEIERLDEASLKALWRLYAWREEVANTENIPAGRLVNDEVLKAIARRRPKTVDDLAQSRLKPHLVRRYGGAAVEAIAASAADPRPRRRGFSPPSPDVAAREDRLKKWRRDEATRRAEAEGRPIPLQLVLPAKALEHLKGVDGVGGVDFDQVPQFGTARRRRYGAAIEALCKA